MRRVAAIALMLWAAAAPAQAQLSAGLAWQSDERFRGVSLSEEQPQARLSLAYDRADGWYGGAALGRMRFDARRRSALLQAYLGRVTALRPGLNGEAGLTLARFPAERGYDYAELYAGLSGSRWSTRLYYSPDYFGRGRRSLYGELELNWPLAPALQGFAHLGSLHGLGDAATTRLDLRAGLAWRWQSCCELQLAGVAAGRGGLYPAVYEQRLSTVVLSLLLAF